MPWCFWHFSIMSVSEMSWTSWWILLFESCTNLHNHLKVLKALTSARHLHLFSVSQMEYVCLSAFSKTSMNSLTSSRSNNDFVPQFHVSRGVSMLLSTWIMTPKFKLFLINGSNCQRLGVCDLGNIISCSLKSWINFIHSFITSSFW